jgi:hypothetical protein
MAQSRRMEKTKRKSVPTEAPRFSPCYGQITPTDPFVHSHLASLLANLKNLQKESARRICGPIIYPHNNARKLIRS